VPRFAACRGLWCLGERTHLGHASEMLRRRRSFCFRYTTDSQEAQPETFRRPRGPSMLHYVMQAKRGARSLVPQLAFHLVWAKLYGFVTRDSRQPSRGSLRLLALWAWGWVAPVWQSLLPVAAMYGWAGLWQSLSA